MQNFMGISFLIVMKLQEGLKQYLSALRDSAIVLVVSLEGPTDRGVRLRQADRQSIRQASRRSGRRLEFSEKSQGIF